MSRLRILLPPRLGENIANGRALLGKAPGVVALLLGGALIWLLTGGLRLPAPILTSLRVLLAVPVVGVYLAMTGELQALRQSGWRARCFLASNEPWRERPSAATRLSILAACRLLRVKPRGWDDER